MSSQIEQLPPEIIKTILSHLRDKRNVFAWPKDLAHIMKASKALYAHAKLSAHWEQIAADFEWVPLKPSIFSETPFYETVRKALNVMRSLYEKTGKPTPRDIERLIEDNIKLGEYSGSILTFAVRWIASKEEIEILIQAGIKPDNRQDQHHNTLSRAYSKNSSKEVIERLIEAGALPDNSPKEDFATHFTKFNYPSSRRWVSLLKQGTEYA